MKIKNYLLLPFLFFNCSSGFSMEGKKDLSDQKTCVYSRKPTTKKKPRVNKPASAYTYLEQANIVFGEEIKKKPQLQNRYPLIKFHLNVWNLPASLLQGIVDQMRHASFDDLIEPLKQRVMGLPLSQKKNCFKIGLIRAHNPKEISLFSVTSLSESFLF